MLVRQQALPAYNIQTAVDTEHALIVAHTVVLDASDIRCLRPMAEAAKEALEANSFKVVADAGYSNGEQVAHCEASGMMPYVPVMRTVNNQGNGTLFGRADFRYEAETDSYVCPGRLIGATALLLGSSLLHPIQCFLYRWRARPRLGACVQRDFNEPLSTHLRRSSTESSGIRVSCCVDYPARRLSSASQRWHTTLNRITNVLGAAKLTRALHQA
jgi:hypothetical protein